MKFFGIFFLVLGIISMILNLIIMSTVKKDCNDNTTIKNTNYANSIIIAMIILAGGGMFLFYSEPEMGFAFG